MKKYRHIIAVLLLLLLYVLLAVGSIVNKAPTYDEPIHIAGGYASLTVRDFRLDPENGLLPNIWAALPHYFTDPGLKVPDIEGSLWRRHDRWRTAQKMIFTPGTDLDWLFLKSRLMMILVGVFTGLAVYVTSNRFWGNNGALISLLVYALSPTLLANSRLATSDLFCALFFLLSSSFFWMLLERFTVLRLFGFAGAVALLALSKMSAVILIPILLVIACIHIALKTNWRIDFRNKQYRLEKWYARSGLIILVFVFTAVFTLFIIWNAYGYRYSMLDEQQNRQGLDILWKQVLVRDQLPEKVIGFCRQIKLLPEAYLYGLAYVVKNANFRHAFLNGKYSTSGWYSFFPLCFLYKTPIPIIALFLLGLLSPFCFLHKDYKKRKMLMIWYLCLPMSIFVIYFGSAIVSKLNIGQRHLLPIYLPMFIVAGGVSILIQKKSWGKSLLSIIASVLFIENLLIFPNYLSYFSPIAGGPGNGYRHLVDSSLDWGQDLKPLKKWLKENQPNNNKAYISYFGSVDLDAYGMKQRRLLCDLEQVSNSFFDLEPGAYCISATMLQMVYYQDMAEWTPELEKEFKESKAEYKKISKAKKKPKELFKLLQQKGRKYWENTLRRYEELRFAKLANGLRKRKPDDMIGYSYLIYDLGQKDIDKIMQ